MREKGGLGPMGIRDKYKPSDMLRLFGESEFWRPSIDPIRTFEPKTTEGIFVIQVRAGLNDCAIPGLKIDQDQREVSLDWSGMFSHFFREREAAELHEGIVGHQHSLDFNISAMSLLTRKRMSELRIRGRQQSSTLFMIGTHPFAVVLY